VFQKGDADALRVALRYPPSSGREITGSNGERGSAHASKGCGVRTGDGDVVSSLSWLLFPAAVTAIMSFFLERIAATVEALDYPGRGPPRRQRIGETIASTLRLTGLTLLLNLLALPVYLLVPGINLFLFLLGREYFEVVALRRLDAAATRAARNRFGLRVFLGGS
jgi:CysZ protein